MRFVVVAVSFLVAAPAAADPEETLRRHGCLGCHSVDGTSGVGPTLAGLDDEVSIRAAITDPVAPMPRLDLKDEEVEALTDAVVSLPTVEPEVRPLWPLALCCGLFVLLHLLLSSRPLRAGLVAKLGEGGFQGLYSVLVALPFAGIFWAWSVRPHVPLWDTATWMRHLPLTLVPLGLFFLVAGYTSKNPTAAGQARALAAPPTGVLTITRHPALWGFLLWALAHVPANGDLASLILFGSIAVLSVAGMIHIDARRRHAEGEAWEAYAAQTSVVPFAAILRGKTRFDGSRMGWQLLVAIAITAATLAFVHEWAFGVPALPYEWVH